MIHIINPENPYAVLCGLVSSHVNYYWGVVVFTEHVCPSCALVHRGGVE